MNRSHLEPIVRQTRTIWGVLGLCFVLLAGCQSASRQPVGESVTIEQAPSPEPPAVPPPPSVATGEPTPQTVQIGESVNGRPIEMTLFGRGNDTTLIMGAFHGSEPASAEVARELIEYLRQHPDEYRGRQVVIITAVNPDGLAAHQRHNAHNIDLNRNWPAKNFPVAPPRSFAGGRQPASEPEVMAVLAAVNAIRPTKIISIHAIRRGRHGNNYDGPARELAEVMAAANGYPVLPTMGYETPGSFGSWSGVDQHLPTITLELPSDADGPTCWENNREALLAAIQFDLPQNANERTVRENAIDPTPVGK